MLSGSEISHSWLYSDDTLAQAQKPVPGHLRHIVTRQQRRKEISNGWVTTNCTPGRASRRFTSCLLLCHPTHHGRILTDSDGSDGLATAIFSGPGCFRHVCGGAGSLLSWWGLRKGMTKRMKRPQLFSLLISLPLSLSPFPLPCPPLPSPPFSSPADRRRAVRSAARLQDPHSLPILRREWS